VTCFKNVSGHFHLFGGLAIVQARDIDLWRTVQAEPDRPCGNHKESSGDGERHNAPLYRLRADRLWLALGFVVAGRLRLERKSQRIFPFPDAKHLAIELVWEKITNGTISMRSLFCSDVNRFTLATNEQPTRLLQPCRRSNLPPKKTARTIAVPPPSRVLELFVRQGRTYRSEAYAYLPIRK